MIYYTGDIHGDPYEVIQFCDSKKLTAQDTLVLLERTTTETGETQR